MANRSAREARQGGAARPISEEDLPWGLLIQNWGQ